MTGVIGIKIPKLTNISELEITSENNILYTDKDDISKFVKLNKEIEEKRLKLDGDSTCGEAFVTDKRIKRDLVLADSQDNIDKSSSVCNRSKLKNMSDFSKA